MKNEYIVLDGVNLKRITKTKAKKLHSNGKTIYIYTSNSNPNSVWINPLILHTDNDFDIFCNQVQYYNCNYFMGYYLKYYIAV